MHDLKIKSMIDLLDYSAATEKNKYKEYKQLNYEYKNLRKYYILLI